MQVINLIKTVLAANKIIRELQRTRSKQRNQRHDIGKPVGLNPFHKILHPAGLELKHRRGLGCLQILINRRILQKQRVDIN